jgi:uncharacterized protein GlcG (DUF336 family)
MWGRLEAEAELIIRKRYDWISRILKEEKMKTPIMVTALLLAICPVRPGSAEDALVTHKVLSPETALDLARAALTACRERGFQVAVAVVDRFGLPQVMLRDRFAGPHTPGTAIGKAWTAVSFRTDTTAMIAPTQPGLPQAGVRNLPNVVLLGGGLLIEAGGSIVGGVGVSGAPGGSEDEACGRAGLEAVHERLEF